MREDGCVYDAYILMRIRMYLHVFERVCVCTYVRICKHVRMYARVCEMCIITYVHTYVCTCIQSCD